MKSAPAYHDGRHGSYPLSVKIRWLSVLVYEITIHPGLVNSIQPPHISIQICLAKRPRLRHRQPVQLVSDFDQSFILIPESLLNLSLAVNV